MEKLGVFGLVEEGTTVLCTDSGDGGERRKDEHKEKGSRGTDEILSSSEMQKENYHFWNAEKSSWMENVEVHVL